MFLTDEQILTYTLKMCNGSIFTDWLRSCDKVSMDTLRDKCSNWLRVNYHTVIQPSSSDMTKIVYTLISRFLGTPGYWKFSDGARAGEKSHSLILNPPVLSAVAPPAPAPPPPWDDISNEPITTVKPTVLSNPCSNVAIGNSPTSVLGYAQSYYFKNTKGNTMEKIYEERAFVKSSDVSLLTDTSLINTIIEIEGKMKRLLDMDTQSKYIRKQVKQYNKDILLITAILDKRV